MNASPQRERDASLQGRTHPTRETLFYLDCLHRRKTCGGAPQPLPLISEEGQWELMSEVMKEMTVILISHVHMCHSWEHTVCVFLYISVQSFEIPESFMFTAEARYSCGPPAHVHLRRSTNLKDKRSFLTTSAVSSPFPFCKLHNLSFEVLVNFCRARSL